MSLSTIGKTRLVKTPSWDPQHTERTTYGPRFFLTLATTQLQIINHPSVSKSQLDVNLILLKGNAAFLLNIVQKYFGISKLTKNWKKGNNSRRLVWQGIQPEKSKHHRPLSQSFDQDYNVLT